MLLAQTAGTLTIMVMRIISKNNNTLPCFDYNRLDEFDKIKVICAALSLINCIQPLIISRTPHPRCKLYRCGPCFVFFLALLGFALLCFALFSSTLLCFVQLCFYFARDCRLQRPWRSTALQRLQIQSAFLYFVFTAYFGVLDILEFWIF